MKHHRHTDLPEAIRELIAQGGLPFMAEMVRQAGAQDSPRDTVLAHIRPDEAELLRSLGGSGRILSTGLPSFDDGDGDGDGGWDSGPGDSGEDQDNQDSGWDNGPGDSGEDQDAQEAGYNGSTASGGAVSYGPDGESYAYGTYSGYDMATWGWGDPEVGFQAGPDEAAAAHAALDAQQNQQAQQAAAVVNGDPFSKGATPLSEDEIQAGFDANNWAGYDSRTGEINTNSTLSGSGRAGASDAAISEYNQASSRGDFAQGWGNWSFADLDGQQQTNWGAIANDASAVLNNPITQTLGYATLGPGFGFATGLANASKGAYDGKSNVQGILGSIGGIVGGKAGQAVGSIVGGLTDGKNMTNTAVSTLLGSTGNLTGAQLGAQTAAGQFGRGSVEQTIAGIAGGYAGAAAQQQAVNATSTILSDALAGSTPASSLSSSSGSPGSSLTSEAVALSSSGPDDAPDLGSVASKDTTDFKSLVSTSPKNLTTSNTTPSYSNLGIGGVTSAKNSNFYSGRKSDNSDWLAGTSKALAATRERNRAALQNYLNTTSARA